MHCGAAIRSNDIVSQRVMGLLDAECAAKHVETLVHGSKRVRHLSSQGRELLKRCGMIEPPQLSARPAPLSAPDGAIGLDFSLDSMEYTQSDSTNKLKSGTKKNV